MIGLSKNAKLLEDNLPLSLDFIADSKLRELSGIEDPEYSEAKRELVDAGLAKIGRGRGGPIRRMGTPKQKVLSKLPKDGSFVSNDKIYESLGMTPEEFYAVQAKLVNEGKVVVGRGRYGRTALVVDGSSMGEEEQYNNGLGSSSDEELQEELRRYFDRKLKPNYEPSPPNLYISKITAQTRPGRRVPNLPDVSILTIMKYDFVPSVNLEVITADVWKHGTLVLEAVYETKSHSIYSHRSYLVFEWIKDVDFERSGRDARIILGEAKRLGIGLIEMRPVDEDKWDFRTILDPELNHPELGELNSFIDLRFKDDHTRIRGAIG
ncbi:hypothetical protein EU538_06955 [Candidatus Thorarchaeota archaeon]|nr:MAG: hypothetical protein EU538_06955 [Candidatus Thorarchaeota archaeon]